MSQPIKKLSRICWNSNDWKKPSGFEGKSKNRDSYEYQYGFGHEEWIFDTTKIIDGYHYAYLQSIANHGDRNAVYDISLYTIKSERSKKVRYWLGEISGVETVDAEESERVLKIYKQNGWYEEMKAQLGAVGAQADELDNISTDYFFVIRFKPENLILMTPFSFSHLDPAVPSNYYNLINYISTPGFDGQQRLFEFTPGNSAKKREGYRAGNENGRTINYIHNIIQEGVYAELCLEYGANNVGTELHTGYDSRIDLVVKTDKASFHFYEIKTGTSVRSCIREALGQIIEYVHFREHPISVNKMFVVGSYSPNADEIKYIKKIREEYLIPVYYQQFDIAAGRLVHREY